MTESGADVKVIMDFKYVYKCVFMSLLNFTESCSLEPLQSGRFS